MVTLISPDGAYGGPLRVALNQAEILIDFGHEVEIAAGTWGYERIPGSIGSVPVLLFPARKLVPGFGYAAVCAPKMGSWIAANAANYDIAHVHFARDLVAIPAARRLQRSGVPTVLQTHGMVVPRSHPLASTVDRLSTNRLLSSAAAVLALSKREVADLRRVGGQNLPVQELANGVPLARQTARASDDPTAVPEVLFFARLHERKRGAAFAEAALKLLTSGTKARFSIVGHPEGDEQAVDHIIARARKLGFGDEALAREPPTPPDKALERMSRASVYVLPAAREPFAMTILEALALELPVVMCADGGLAQFVTQHRCGVVVDGSVASLATAIDDLLVDRDAARQMGARGRRAVEAELSITAVGRQLEAIYERVIHSRKESV
ncbi:glycosyltransferase [Mycolicibacterium rufum]|uniref:Glycosyltransferase n=1 Tax=Mycolicibacterium rufum TaxID=318424 RepID=A0A9X2Y3U7_9MYCO|nr:glycosyltransferase [Mycolicibacterium rufum]MCV7073456.1 glycosyltransferase [Mycolicibacterium rufum]ULP38232.1 glycosyltransferase [Mycolicibacterium rufum]